VRSFFDTATLAAHDIFSPLPPPMLNAGPFMLYRNSKPVNNLAHESADLRRVARSGTYEVFDEWWGKLREPMPTVVARAAREGRVRSYAPQPPETRWWLADDYVYDRRGLGGGGSAQRPSGSGPSEEGWWMRQYDSRLVYTWRDGALYAGRPPDGGLEGGGGGGGGSEGGKGRPLLVLHLLGTKRREAFRRLEATDHLLRLAAHASEVVVSPRGLWLKVSRQGRSHSWYSGAFPGVHVLVRSTELARAIAAAAEAAPNRSASSSPAVDAAAGIAPCVYTAKFDDQAVPPGSCDECSRIQAAAEAAAANATARACGGDRAHLGAHLSFECEPRGGSVSARGLPACAARLALRGGHARRECHAALARLARRSLALRLPRTAQPEAVPMPSLTPAWSLAHGLEPCLGRAVAAEQRSQSHASS